MSEITSAMEKEERAIREETCREQQQMMDKVDRYFVSAKICTCFLAFCCSVNQEIWASLQP